MKRWFIVLVLLALPIQASASATFLQLVSGSGGTGTTSATSPTITTHTGNLVIVATIVGGGTTNPVTSVTDTGGNGYAFISSADAGNGSLFGGCKARLFYSVITTGVAGAVTGHTGTNISGFSNMTIVEYSNAGGWAGTILDGVGVGGTGNGTPSTSAATLAQANELVVGQSVNATGTPSWVDLTDREFPIVAGERFGDYQGAGAGSYTTKMGGSGGQYIITSAAFKVPLPPYVPTRYGAFVTGP
jgi:hypothetical protein